MNESQCGLSLVRNETQSGRIHAITQARGARSVSKYVAQVSVAERALHFRPRYAERNIFSLANVALCDGFEKAGPSGAGIEFATRTKQCVVAIDTAVESRGVLIMERAGESPFRGSTPGYIKLQSGELRFPLGVGFVHLCHGRGTERSPIVRKFGNFYGPIIFAGLDAIRESGGTDALHAKKYAATEERCR